MSDAESSDGGREGGPEGREAGVGRPGPRVRMKRVAAERPYRALTDSQLVTAMQCGQGAALAEFIVRFWRLLLDRGRRMGFASAEASDIAYEVLEDIAIAIAEGSAPPASLSGYLVGTFRNRCLNHRRRHQQRERAVHEGADESAGEGERTLWGACSQHLLHSVQGPDWESAPLAPVLERLVSAFDEGTTEEERLILQWISDFTSQREIAAWLGVSYAAATQRIRRLRERLREAAARYARALDGAEQRELQQYFRRWSFVYDVPRSKGAAVGGTSLPRRGRP